MLDPNLIVKTAWTLPPIKTRIKKARDHDRFLYHDQHVFQDHEVTPC